MTRNPTLLLDRLRGKTFTPGVHYAEQERIWMLEAADAIEILQRQLSKEVSDHNLTSADEKAWVDKARELRISRDEAVSKAGELSVRLAWRDEVVAGLTAKVNSLLALNEELRSEVVQPAVGGYCKHGSGCLRFGCHPVTTAEFESAPVTPVPVQPGSGHPVNANIWWAIHNLVAHPFSEACYWVGLSSMGNRFHDWTVPDHVPGEGRG